MEISRERDPRSPAARTLSRAAYQHKLRRALERQFADYAVARLTTGMDLEKSFGPVLTGGLIQKGQSAFAVLGVNAEETQSSIDAALTFGILWLDECRTSRAGKAVGEGLKLFVPCASSGLVRERMGVTGAGVEIDCADRGNVTTRLVYAPDTGETMNRFSKPVAKVRSLLPNCEVAVI